MITKSRTYEHQRSIYSTRFFSKYSSSLGMQFLQSLWLRDLRNYLSRKKKQKKTLNKDLPEIRFSFRPTWAMQCLNQLPNTFDAQSKHKQEQVIYELHVSWAGVKSVQEWHTSWQKWSSVVLKILFVLIFKLPNKT